MLHKFWRHTNSIILDNKLVIAISMTERGILHDAKSNRTACRRVFHGIAQ